MSSEDTAKKLGEAVKREYSNVHADDFYSKFNFKLIPGSSTEDNSLKLKPLSSEDRVLDLLLILDCTGSMQSWINACKATLVECIADIKAMFPNLQVRVAFVGYRDLSDGDNIFAIHDFTFDLEAVKKLISETDALGGGDAPEDVQGAFHQSLKLSWRLNSLKFCYFCADYPCHGKDYHATHDNYPDGNPANLVLEDLMYELSSKEIDLTVYILTNQTDKMYDIMEKAYDQGATNGRMKRIDLQELAQNQRVNNKRVHPSRKYMFASKAENSGEAKVSDDMNTTYAKNWKSDMNERLDYHYAKNNWSK